MLIIIREKKNIVEVLSERWFHERDLNPDLSELDFIGYTFGVVNKGRRVTLKSCIDKEHRLFIGHGVNRIKVFRHKLHQN